MAAKKRKIINLRQLKVAEIWERDPQRNQSDIAQILEDEFGIKVSQPTISNDLQAIDKRIQAKSEAVIMAVREKILFEYERVYGEAFSAWLKSLEDAESETSEVIETPEEFKETGNKAANKKKQRLKVQSKREGQSGNAALLGQAQNALKSIRELLGLDIQSDPGSNANNPIYHKMVVLPPKDE